MLSQGLNRQPEMREIWLLKGNIWQKRQSIGSPKPNAHCSTLGQKNMKLPCRVVKAETAFPKLRAQGRFDINKGLRLIHPIKLKLLFPQLVILSPVSSRQESRKHQQSWEINANLLDFPISNRFYV